MMNIWHDPLSRERVNETDFDAVIEITKGGRGKIQSWIKKPDFEIGSCTLHIYPLSGKLRFYLTHISCRRRENPLDVLVLCSEHILPLALVRCYPIRAIRMIDGGERRKNHRNSFNDPTYNTYKDINELPKHIFDEMSLLLLCIQELEHKVTAIEEVSGRDAAIEIISSTSH